jgi:hypothetical protein
MSLTQLSTRTLPQEEQKRVLQENGMSENDRDAKRRCLCAKPCNSILDNTRKPAWVSANIEKRREK